MFICRFLYIIESFILAFFNGFWPLLIAKIVSGVGVSLNSGTVEAFLYDTLKRQKREKNKSTKRNERLRNKTRPDGKIRKASRIDQKKTISFSLL